MTPELQKYYENQFALFGEPGWRDFIDDLKKIEAATNTIDAVTPDKSVEFRRGELSILRMILSRETVWNDAYERLTKGEGDDETPV